MATVAKTTLRDVRSERSLAGAKVREALVGYGFILVPMTIFGVWYLYPLGYSIYISFYDWGVLGKIAGVGTRNYDQLFHDPIFGKALKNTLLYTGVVVPLQMSIGLFMALIVNSGIRAKTFFRAAFYFPSLASSAAITAIFIYILNADGLLNTVIGGHRAWFGDARTALWAIIGQNAWTTSGTMMLFYLAALQAIPTDVYEAAAVDGTSKWRTFWKITFPLLKPGHFFVAVVSVIGALKVFDQAFIVSNGTGGPNYATTTAVLYLYRTTFYQVKFGYAAAMGVLIFLIIFAFTLLQRLAFGRPEVQ